MVAEAILQDFDPRACNCRLRLDRGGLVLVVKAGCWDCPSCGYDKRRSLVQMCVEAGAALMLTLTFEQPRSVMRGKRVTPQGFERCQDRTHVREVKDRWGKKSTRWLTLPECVHCCRRVSGMVHRFVKAARRRFPQFSYLRVTEEHKSGAWHQHWAVVGVDASAQDELGALWRGLGGGRQVDLRARPGGSAERVGLYLGKYLGKRHDQRMARGYRRWSRARMFAPGVLMAWSEAARRRFAVEKPEVPAVVVQVATAADFVSQFLDTMLADAHELVRVGWVHPELSGVVTRVRLFAQTLT